MPIHIYLGNLSYDAPGSVPSGFFVQFGELGNGHIISDAEKEQNELF